MDKFNHLFVLCGLLIPLSWAQTNVTTTPIIPTLDPSRQTVTGNFTGNISTNSVQTSNSSVPSPTFQTTITTVQINSSTTSLATQPTSKLTTTAASITLTTLHSSAVTEQGNDSTFSTVATNFTTIPGNKTNNETTGTGLKFSEKYITILFSVILGVIVLLALGQIVYKVSRNKHRSVKYSHSPLYNEDTGEHFVVPDDTLVISGGLYDGPQIYNPTVTALNDEDQPTFPYMPAQLRLEFLREDQGTDQHYEATSFETFKTTDTSLK